MGGCSKKRMEEIRKGTTEDEALQQVINFIQNGWPDENNALPGAVKPYFSVRNELTVDDGLIWKGDRCVIPMTMRKKSMQLIHSSHIGIESCLRRAREYVYWPGMNHEIKDFISKCDVCNRLRSSQMREPLESHDVPSRAWSTLSADLFQFKGQQYLIVVDHYSNYFDYERLENETSFTVIRRLKTMFSRYGIPEKVVSDNGPQFSSQEFRICCRVEF
jgi:hypothetical protein